jgi:Acylphosphatases
MKHVNMVIKGDVQGVNFRSHVREKARELHLTGLVKNMTDGTVYVEVEGEEGAIERFADWCRQDPGSAQVDEVRVKEGAMKHFTDFTIR